MATNMKRVTISISESMENDIKMLKRTLFYDKTYSELYRQLLHHGIDSLKEKRNEENREDKA